MKKHHLPNAMKIRSKQYKQYILDTINEFNSNGKKTVLITCDCFHPIVDGVVRVVENYARELSPKMNVMLLVPAYCGKIGSYGYPIIAFTSAFSRKLNYEIPLPMLDARCKRYLRKLRIDLIHCHSPFIVGRVAMRLHKKRKIPLVCTFHSQFKRDFEQHAKPLAKFLLKYVMRCFNSSTETWTMHSASRDTLISYGYNGKVLLMPNGTSMPPSPNYQQERESGRTKYMSDPNKLLFIFVGRLVEQKNILFVVDVLAQLKKRGVEFKMLFVGEGPDKQKLQHKIEQLGLQQEIELEGKLRKDQLQEVYAAADLFLFPSMYDVSSLVQVEAAARYTPTVFAEGSVTSCTVTDGVNGYILPCEVNAFAEGVYNIVQHKDTLNTVSSNAYRDLYVTWNSLMDKVYDRYMQLIENKD